jgi:hypothetical protein
MDSEIRLSSIPPVIYPGLNRETRVLVSIQVWLAVRPTNTDVPFHPKSPSSRWFLRFSFIPQTTALLRLSP